MRDTVLMILGAAFFALVVGLSVQHASQSDLEKRVQKLEERVAALEDGGLFAPLRRPTGNTGSIGAIE